LLHQNPVSAPPIKPSLKPVRKKAPQQKTKFKRKTLRLTSRYYTKVGAGSKLGTQIKKPVAKKRGEFRNYFCPAINSQRLLLFIGLCGC